MNVLRALVSNPPFNLKWDVPPFAIMQERFKDAIPSKSSANFVFVLTALQEADRCAFIFPCVVLSGNNSGDKDCIKYFVDNNYLDSIILLPRNMFVSTDIGTCIMLFDKHKKTRKVSFVDLREKGTEEVRNQRGQFGGNSHENRVYSKHFNVLTDEVMDEAVKAITERSDTKGYSKSVAIDDIKANDYDINPTKYIEFKYTETPHRSYADIVRDLNAVIDDKNALKITVNETLAKRLGLYDIALLNKESNMNSNAEFYEKLAGEKIKQDNYISLSKNKLEFKVENKSDKGLSPVLAMIVGMWKQHIYYLNEKENFYLAELRDALLPDLMEGRIEV